MPFNIIKIHHADHGITPEVIQALVDQLKPTGFFLKTMELPAGAPDAPCGIYGPNMGDAPVPESEVVYKQRTPDRPMSRMVARPTRPVRIVTLIGMATPESVGGGGDSDWALGLPQSGPRPGVVIWTCYGGPAAEREPGDKSLQSPEEIAAAKEFWSQHALCL